MSLANTGEVLFTSNRPGDAPSHQGAVAWMDEVAYRPVRAQAERTCRLVILRKRIRVERGPLRLQDEIRFFFYVTNVPRRELCGEEVIFQANARCSQENVIEQLKNGVAAMRMPSDTLLSNWASSTRGR